MTILKAILLPFLALLLIGCSSAPEKTVESMYDSLKKGDLPKLLNSTTDQMSGALAARALRDCSVDKKSYTDNLKLVQDCMVEMYSKLDVKKIKLIKEDKNTALIEVIVKNDSIENTTKINLIKVDNEWQVTLDK